MLISTRGKLELDLIMLLSFVHDELDDDDDIDLLKYFSDNCNIS